MTLIKFCKPMASQDESDYCCVEGVRYRMACAYGQSSPRDAVFHAPVSSLESGTGSNNAFYKPHAMLFHVEAPPLETTTHKDPTLALTFSPKRAHTSPQPY